MAFGISDVIAALSLIISSIAIVLTYRFRSHVSEVLELQKKVNSLWIDREKKRQQEKEEENKPTIGARLINWGTKKKRLRVFNAGQTTARNVSVELPDDNHFVVSNDLESKFPMEKMESGQKVDVIAATSMGSPSKHSIRLKWEDDQGKKFKKDALITD